jgi:hypothetical protein
MRGPLLAVVIAASALAACGAPPAVASPWPEPPAPPGTLTVTIAPRFGWPYRIQRVAVAVDGARASTEPVRVAPGVHSVAFLTDIAVPCGLFSDRRLTIRVRDAEALVVGAQPAAARVEIDAWPDASLPLERRIRVRWTYPNATTSDEGGCHFGADVTVLGSCGVEPPDPIVDATREPQARWRARRAPRREA